MGSGFKRVVACAPGSALQLGEEAIEFCRMSPFIQ